MARTAETGDRVRDLQRTLYRAAKADPGRRFHALYDKIWRRDVLERAWSQVRANRGAAGIDRVTLADLEEYGVSRLLDELAADLKGQRWRPLPARRVWIPKPGTTEQRPLSIPAVRDRIVQAAAKIVLEPIFEADMAAHSYGFRPKAECTPSPVRYQNPSADTVRCFAWLSAVTRPPRARYSDGTPATVPAKGGSCVSDSEARAFGVAPCVCVWSSRSHFWLPFKRCRHHCSTWAGSTFEHSTLAAASMGALLLTESRVRRKTPYFIR